MNDRVRRAAVYEAGVVLRVLPANPLDIADAVSMRILVGWICRLYQDLECIMPHDQSPGVGGAYAKRRRGDTTSREFTGDDGVNRARIHGAAAAFRARVGGLFAGPHQ